MPMNSEESIQNHSLIQEAELASSRSRRALVRNVSLGFQKILYLGKMGQDFYE